MIRRQLFVTGLVVLAACGTGTTEDDTPPTEPPWGLDAVEQPTDPAPVIAALPEQVAGLPLDMIVPEGVTYAQDARSVQLLVLHLADLREFSGDPKLTFPDYFTVLIESGEMEEVESSGLVADHSLVWVAGTVVGDGDLSYTASWATPDGEVGFSVTADSDEARAALIHAFIDALDAG